MHGDGNGDKDGDGDRDSLSAQGSHWVLVRPQGTATPNPGGQEAQHSPSSV